MNSEDPFAAVEKLEEQAYAEGSREGIADGQQKSWENGFVLGWQQACHLLQELGQIEGLLSSLLLNCGDDISPRLLNQISKLMSAIRECREWNPVEEERIEAKLAAIHTKSRFIFQQLKIPASVVNRSVDGDF